MLWFELKILHFGTCHGTCVMKPVNDQAGGKNYKSPIVPHSTQWMHDGCMVQRVHLSRRVQNRI